MSLSNLISHSRIALAAGIGFFLASCSTKSVSNGGTISKVNPYHLHNAAEPIPAADPSITFERASLLHGAISVQERAARQGDYFTIFWKVDDRSQPVTVRLEYRQKLTGLAIKKVEQEISDVGRNNVTKFSIIGEDFVTNGHVTAWRALLVRGGQVLTTYNSYLWE